MGSAQPNQGNHFGRNSSRGHFEKRGAKFLTHRAPCAQDLQFLAKTHTIRNRNRPAKQVGDQRWLNLHSLNRGSTRQSVLCAVSASPECLMNRGEPHRLRTGSPAHYPRPSGSAFYFSPLVSTPLEFRQLPDSGPSPSYRILIFSASSSLQDRSFADPQLWRSCRGRRSAGPA